MLSSLTILEVYTLCARALAPTLLPWLEALVERLRQPQAGGRFTFDVLRVSQNIDIEGPFLDQGRDESHKVTTNLYCY